MSKNEQKKIGVKFLGFLTVCFIFLFVPFIASASIETNPEIPNIIPRSEWGADESKMFWEAEYSNVKKFVIHHTASSTLNKDSDGSGEYKNAVNNIYTYHTDKKIWTDNDGETIIGFGDIGYNYLIDPNGNIYEGRYGGNGVIGGHATGFNDATIGIAVLGNYQESSATNDSVNSKITKSLEKLIGWLAANNSVNINKKTTINGKTIDGVVGHKDVAATLCPGDLLYEKLDGIQENAYLYYKAYKNYAYKVSGSKAVYILENGNKIKFDSQNDLPEIYKNRTIKTISKSQLASYQYEDLTVYPDGSLLQAAGDTAIYYIQNGKKRILEMNEEEFLKMEFKKEDIITVSKNEIGIYENGLKIEVGPEGSLIQDKNNNVYLIELGRKRQFTSANLFEQLGYSWNKIKIDEKTDYYLNGKVMTYKQDSLVKTKNNPDVYLIVEDGKRRVFPSSELFLKLGYKWSNIMEIESSEMSNYGLLGSVLYPNGTLIKGEGEQTVFLVENSQKREITSETLLQALGYNFSNVITIAKNSLIDYVTGDPAKYPNGSLIKTKTSSAVYQISNGERKEFTSLALFEAIGGKWKDVIEITEQEMTLYKKNGTVRYPENSLIKSVSGEKIYVIENDQAVWIETLEDFIKAGYKWADVINIDATEMKLYINSSNETSSKIDVIDQKTENATETEKEVVDNEEQDNSSDSQSDAKENYEIRVAITYSEGSNITLTANGNYTIEYYDQNNNIYKTVKKEKDEKTVVPFFDWEKYMRFVPESENVILQVLSYEDPSWNKETNDNRFRGVIELKYSNVSNKLWVINELDLEDYLNGIAEATTYTETEYLKAFSTIARTYAMYYIEKNGKHAGEDFHLKNSRNGNGNDQVYRGYDLEMRAPSIVAANKATGGQIIKFKEKTIVAAYSSDSGGVTKSACEVLSKNYCDSDFDYLDGGVKDPDDTEHSQAKISASHGAGMSAVGANQMAIEGSSWQDIIKHYYSGVQISKIY